MSRNSEIQVTRRRVFYIPGFDPMPPRRYRELYRAQSARQAEISGYTIAMAPKEPGATFGWEAQATIDGIETRSQIDVLIWADIVRDSMSNEILSTYAQLVRTARVYIASGALFRLMRLRKGPVIAALYPVIFLLFQAVLAIGLGMLALSLLGPILSIWIALPIAIALAWGVIDVFRRKDGRFFAHYLMHDYAFSARHNGANPPVLEERMRLFADEIAAALTETQDEVLVVGHSSGAHLAVSILADLLRQRRVPANGPVLSFLSLGQVVPMMSFLPEAHRLRADLRFLSQQDRLTWIDVTAPGDGCAFALCDPVAVTGVAPPSKRWPLVISAAFTQTLAPDTWKALRWRFFRLHFQYLCAFDRPGVYDYFRITAGPETLGARFAGRAPSKSRIERAVNKFTSVAA